jgi:hypothetical protein
MRMAVDGTSSGPYPMADFGIRGAELSVLQPDIQ